MKQEYSQPFEMSGDAIILLYSKYSGACRKFFKHLRRTGATKRDVIACCVDNPTMRRIITESKKIKVSKVPCLIIPGTGAIVGSAAAWYVEKEFRKLIEPALPIPQHRASFNPEATALYTNSPLAVVQDADDHDADDQDAAGVIVPLDEVSVEYVGSGGSPILTRPMSTHQWNSVKQSMESPVSQGPIDDVGRDYGPDYGVDDDPMITSTARSSTALQAFIQERSVPIFPQMDTRVVNSADAIIPDSQEIPDGMKIVSTKDVMKAAKEEYDRRNKEDLE